MADVIRSATDRLAIRALGVLLMDHACLLVENPIHEQGSLRPGAKSLSLIYLDYYVLRRKDEQPLWISTDPLVIGQTLT